VFGHLDYRGLSLKASYQTYDKHVPFAPFGSVFNSPINHFLTTRGYVDAGYEGGRPERLQFTVRAFFDVATYGDDLLTPTSTTTQTFHDEAHPYWGGAELKLLTVQQVKDALRATLTAGGDVTYLHGDQKSGFVGDPNPIRIANDVVYGAVYGQAELLLYRRVALTLGLRGDFSSASSSELSPRAGLVLFPWSTGTVKLLYAHGFIHPSWYQVFFNDGTSLVDNRMLGPERADNYELVFQQQLGKPLLLSASGFYIHGQHLIEQQNVCANGTPVQSGPGACTDQRQQFQNTGSFESAGAEVSLTGRLPRGVRLFANYTLAYATDSSNHWALNSPHHLVKAGLSVPVWRDHLLLGAELRFGSARRYDPTSTATTDPFAAVSAHVIWRDLPRGFSLMVKVYDVTAQTWYDPSVTEESSPILRVPHAGPSIVGRLSYEY
jgi:outer membrane receptor protein involved in Fe transport